jgi:Gram-negative bacterial TonB protein C-terminal
MLLGDVLQGALAALALMAVAAPAAAQPAADTRTDAERAAAAQMMAFYPPKALAAGTIGQVNLLCDTDAHYALRNCRLQNETPAGQGFGAAALAAAARSPDNPALTLAPRRNGGRVFMLFCASPPSVTPVTLLPRHIEDFAEIKRWPTAAEAARVAPPSARRKHFSGGVDLDCAVGLDGRVADCRVTQEIPEDRGLGAAALRVAPALRGTPRRIDGHPVAGGRAPATIRFGPGPPFLMPIAIDQPAPANPQQLCNFARFKGVEVIWRLAMP